MLDMMEMSTIAGAVVVGVVLGVFYFGGLWLTVRRMSTARHPLSLYFSSLIIRLAVVLAACYCLLIHYDWPLLVASVTGLGAIRIVLIRFLGHASRVGSSGQETI